MSIVKKYRNFVSEELSSSFRIEKGETGVKNSINRILSFLKDNQVKDWNDFLSMSAFDRQVVDKLIDSETDDVEDLIEIRFVIRLSLSDKPQLKKMMKEYELMEEYERCSKILKKITKM